MVSKTVLSALLLSAVQPSIAGYVLKDNYNPSNFFGQFDFFTAGDPTHGFVKYVDQGTATNTGLINTKNNAIYMGVDKTNVTPNGRPSVRITSKKSYNHGLFLFDIAHMPGSICGVWPAAWLVGPNWPSSGEIDIIEGVNRQSSNSMTLHTGPGCSINGPGSGAYAGTLVTPNCDVNAPGQSANAGCSIGATAANTYGTGFNNIGGGVYAMEWTSKSISIWFFPRSAIPADIKAGTAPNPAGWGKPQANFQGACNIDSVIKNQQIVFDTTFCGDWAGNVWGQDSTCTAKASTCSAFVQNNPSAFAEAYWSLNSVKVFSSSSTQSALEAPAADPVSSAAAAPIAVSTSPAQPQTTLVVETKTATRAAAATTSLTPLDASLTIGASPTTTTTTRERGGWGGWNRSKRAEETAAPEVEKVKREEGLHAHLQWRREQKRGVHA